MFPLGPESSLEGRLAVSVERALCSEALEQQLQPPHGKQGQVTSVGEPQQPTAVEWPGAA